MLKYIPPIVRSCCNYVILSQNSNVKQVEALSEEYGGTYGNEIFKELFSKATNIPYGFLYLDLYGFTGNNNNPKAYSNFDKLLYEAPISYNKKSLNFKGKKKTKKNVDNDMSEGVLE